MAQARYYGPKYVTPYSPLCQVHTLTLVAHRHRHRNINIHLCTKITTEHHQEGRCNPDFVFISYCGSNVFFSNSSLFVSVSVCVVFSIRFRNISPGCCLDSSGRQCTKISDNFFSQLFYISGVSDRERTSSLFFKKKSRQNKIGRAHV